MNPCQLAEKTKPLRTDLNDISQKAVGPCIRHLVFRSDAVNPHVLFEFRPALSAYAADTGKTDPDSSIAVTTEGYHLRCCFSSLSEPNLRLIQSYPIVNLLSEGEGFQ